MSVTIRTENLGEVIFNTEDDFSISEDNLNGCICMMGQRLVEYGEVYAELKAELGRRDADVSRVYAYYDLWFRDKANYPPPDGKKLTEGNLKGLIETQQAYQDAVDQLNKTRLNLYKIENFYRSLHKNADLLQALVYKHNNELKHTY